MQGSARKRVNIHSETPAVNSAMAASYHCFILGCAVVKRIKKPRIRAAELIAGEGS